MSSSGRAVVAVGTEAAHRQLFKTTIFHGPQLYTQGIPELTDGGGSGAWEDGK